MPLHHAIAQKLRARRMARTHAAYLHSLRLVIYARDMRPRTKREWRLATRMLRVYPGSTMVSPHALLSACSLVERVERASVPGAIVECGVWRGGCSALMGSVLQDLGSSREQWLFDSFQGLPAASERDGRDAAELANERFDGALEPVGDLGVDPAHVKRLLFDRFRLDPSRVHIVEGWFQDTLPMARATIGPIAILRLDGDWYDSTMTCLNALYDQVSPGGFVIVDDYGALEGCRRAVHDFFAAKCISPEIVKVDDWVTWFQKPS